MTINERVSDERLNTISAEYSRPNHTKDFSVKDWEIAAIARELQQCRAAAEPVAFRWRWKDDGMNKPGEWIYHDMMHFEAINRQPTRECQLVYAAPQVTSVPDIEELRAAFETVERETRDNFNLSETLTGSYEDEDTQQRWEVWLDCRAFIAAPAVQEEQLSGNTEPVSHPYTLPPHVYRELVNSLRDTAAKYRDSQQLRAQISNTLRSAIAPANGGNSPVIPDSSNRIPNDVAFEKWWEDEKYDEKLRNVQGVIFNRVKNAAFRAFAAGRNGYCAVLAAAPKQETLYTCPGCGEQSYEDMGGGALRCCDCGERFTKTSGAAPDKDAE